MLAFLCIVACSEDEHPTSTVIAIPDPTVEDNHPFRNTEQTYFMPWTSFGDKEPPVEAAALMKEILEEGMLIENAWFPRSGSPCMVIGAMPVVAMELKVADTRILGYGFLENPAEWWAINCGVPSLWHYSFD
jgi:hypothetical protein